MAKKREKIERPMYLDELVSKVRYREALKPIEDVAFKFEMFAAADRQPEVECYVEPVESEKEEEESGMYRVNLELKGLRLGRHAYPPKAQLR